MKDSAEVLSVILIGMFIAAFLIVYGINASVRSDCIDAGKDWTTTSSITGEGNCK